MTEVPSRVRKVGVRDDNWNSTRNKEKEKDKQTERVLNICGYGRLPLAGHQGLGHSSTHLEEACCGLTGHAGLKGWTCVSPQEDPILQAAELLAGYGE